MLRITNQNEKDQVVLRLEGKLAGPWVEVLRDCWKEKSSPGVQAIQVDLAGVTFVDNAGRALLREMSASNAQLLAKDCHMRAILAEISASHSQPR